MTNNQDRITMLEKIRRYLLKRVNKEYKRRKLVYDLAYNTDKTKN